MLKQLVNNKDLYEAFLDELKREIENCRLSLERYHDPVIMHQYQGEIKALRRLMTLRERINAKDKEY